VRISSAGFATAVWSDQNGVWTADRPPASNWNSPQLLIPGASNPIFAMNSVGDAAIAWTVGGGPRSTSGTVMAVRRPAGSAWTSQQTVASGVHLSADHAGISANGAVIVTWETYNAVCTRYGCALSNYVLHASRQNAGTNSWVDSGLLLGPDLDGHAARVALDSTGEAILVAFSASDVYISTNQGSSGGAWSPFKTVVNPPNATIVSDLASDDAGQVTMVYELISYPTSQALAVSATISSNTWSSPVVLSGSDTSVGQVYFALAPNGTALVVWLSSSDSRGPRRHTKHPYGGLGQSGCYLWTGQLHRAGSRRGGLLGKCDRDLFRLRHQQCAHGVRDELSALAATRDGALLRSGGAPSRVR
jgi:hypothetical protein